MTEVVLKDPHFNFVGPILQESAASRAIVIAIQNLNPHVQVIHRDSYIRVSVENKCVLTKESVEQCLGQSFHLPSDLEKQMLSFKGRFSVDEGKAVWLAPRETI